MEQVFRTPRDGFYFFGYYDKSAHNASNTRLLAHQVSCMDRLPVAGEAAQIGYFEFPDGRTFNRLTSTCAWNFQMGAMLQWLGPDFESLIIFNDLRAGKFVAVIYDLERGLERILPLPVYAVDPLARTAACVDFERLYWYRPGYNYQGIENEDKKIDCAPDDGLWILDLNTHGVEQLVFLGELTAMRPVASMEGAQHYVEHVSYAPGGRRIAFQHRWRGADGATYTRLYVLGLEDRKLRLVSDSGRVSHYCWRDDDTILAFGGARSVAGALRRRPTLVKALVRPILPAYYRLRGYVPGLRQALTRNGYTLIDVGCGDLTRVAGERLTEDGHPSFRPGSPNVFATDTYADPNDHTLDLMLFDLETGELEHIATLSSSPEADGTGWRCDLHPKWSHDGRYLAVDTQDGGGRGILVFGMSDRELSPGQHAGAGSQGVY